MAMAVIAAAVLVSCVPASPTQPVGIAAAGTWQGEMLVSLNAERAAVGVGPLASCDVLHRVAQDHSADQATHNRMSHTGSDGSSPWQRMLRAGYDYRSAAENVAAGQSGVAQVMSAWMGSSGHRNNILNPGLEHVGVGLAHSAGGTPYWTQVFGSGGSC